MEMVRQPAVLDELLRRSLPPPPLLVGLELMMKLMMTTTLTLTLTTLDGMTAMTTLPTLLMKTLPTLSGLTRGIDSTVGRRRSDSSALSAMPRNWRTVPTIGRVRMDGATSSTSVTLATPAILAT